MRLDPVADAGHRDALLAGDVGELDVAPGWPHEDTRPGMSFLDSGGRAFLIIDDDGRIAGECGTKSQPNSDGVVEIGYGLAAPSRGKGLGTAAVRALVGELRDDPAVRGIEAEVHIGNEPSLRILESLGFTRSQQPANGYVRYLLPVGPGRGG
jgi:RimJ/RimL family protein N-acetyltransferase